MSVEIQEVHQAPGSWSVELDWRPEIAQELLTDSGLPRRVHVLVYDPWDQLIYCGVQTRGEGGRAGLTIGGPGLAWWADGPVIVERDYLSGANKLSDGDFALDVVGQRSIYWQIPDGSMWEIGPDDEAIGPSANAARTTATLVADDILTSAEQIRAAPGRIYVARARFQLSGAVGPGLLRLRTVYGGRFQHPDLASPYEDWTESLRGDITRIPDPTDIVAGPCLRISTTLVNLIPNGTFEEGGAPDGWVQYAGLGTWALGTDGGYGGDPNYMYTDDSTTPPVKVVSSSADGLSFDPAIPQMAEEGQEFDFWLLARTHPGSTTDGFALLVALIDGDNGLLAFETPLILADAAGEWRQTYSRFTAPAGATSVVPQVRVAGHTTGQWDIDEVVLRRLKGNYDYVTGQPIAVIPERAYRWTMPYRIEASVTGGLVQLRAICSCSSRPDPPVTIEGPSLASTVDATGVQRISWEMRTPSGYDIVRPQIYAADVTGGAYWLGEGTIVDADESTYVLDGGGRPDDGAGYVTVSHTSTAPVGTETVHLEVVAEAQSGLWIAGRVELLRIDTAGLSGNEIVVSLLRDPDTGAALSIVPGRLDCPEPIPYDWTVRRLSIRAALEHYCAVVSEPPREYRVNPNRTVDVATADSLFTDRTSVVLMPADVDVGALPGVDSDVSERATEIVVVGAERATTTGQPPILITASADVGGPEVDWNGNPEHRTRVVSDSTVDHQAYAQALADDLALREAEPALALSASLTGAGTRPEFGVGDWIYVYAPEDGLYDTDNPVEVNGQEVCPRRVRVLERTRSLGSTHRVEVRRADGSTFDLPGVRWSEADTTTLTIGDRIPEWMSDPQGGDAGRQYLRDRASRAQ